MKNHLKDSIVKSPLNYPGNKVKVLTQFKSYFPKEIKTFYDVFGGSGVVGVNSTALNINYNDISVPLVNLMKYLYLNPIESIVEKVEFNINKYGLTNTNLFGNIYPIKKYEGLSLHNKKGYETVRSDYNNDNSRNDLLLLLLIYGFNHYFRFNSNGIFNVPVGKVDFHKDIVKNLNEFVSEMQRKKVQFTNLSFDDKNLYVKVSIDDFVYFDPPYLITVAPYNQSWSEKEDIKLFNLFDQLSKANIKTAMSNVLQSNGKTNINLINWSKKYKIINISRKYLNSNYRKKNISEAKEVLILNY